MVRDARQLCEEILPNANPLMVGDIWECLDALGGVVHHDADWDRTERQIRAILTSEPSEYVYREAYGAWIQQMDGSYQREYGEVICSLSEDERHRLEELAFMSLQQEPVLFDIILIEGAVTRLRSEFEPVFRRLAEPPIKAVFRQDATRAFLLAAIGLSRLGAQYPLADTRSGVAAAWWTLAGIFCELCSVSGPNEERMREAWSCLCGDLIDDVIQPISDMLGAESGDRESSILQASDIRKFPGELRDIARYHVSKYETAGHKQDWDRNRRLTASIDLIGAYGESKDVELLRRFVDDASCARAAIDAIRSIRTRFAAGGVLDA